MIGSAAVHIGDSA